ncbi:beta-lactamase/transpeptidase-like protein [Mycena sanguinolenta]|nr:beta-lactamase/transpeptidase-like protein [Mycena sanguinolenta]
MTPLLLIALLPLVASSQIPLQRPFFPSKNTLLTPKIEEYITSQLSYWNSSGLAVAVVKKDEGTGAWNTEFGSYGRAHADGSPVTPDTLFAIASDSKLFLATGVGLLIKNESLAENRGEKLRWDTKIAALLPEWGLMDDEASRGVTIQDMLSHRTGLPRHDYSGRPREGGVGEMAKVFVPCRALSDGPLPPSQYNNLMYEALSHLQPTLLNRTFESYIAEYIFTPLGMNSSTYSVAEAEARGTLAHGFHWSMKDSLAGQKGTLIATVPYFQRPGEENIWAGAAGILSSARDLSVWVAMLLNGGRHPTTNVTVIPDDVVEHVALGASVSLKKAEFPESSAKVYGCGQNRFSYRGHEIVEHGGSNPGFKTIVSRLPHDNIGVVVLLNDDNGVRVMEPVKFQILDTLLGLEPIDWAQRYVNDETQKLSFAELETDTAVTPRPSPPLSPASSFKAMEGSFIHPTYGSFSLCYVQSPASLTCSDRTFSTHLRLAHFSGNLFNASVIWSNHDVRRAEGHTQGDDVLVGLDNRFAAEWVPGETTAEDGFAFSGDFWGKDGDVRDLEGGQAGAEVWFQRAS